MHNTGIICTTSEANRKQPKWDLKGAVGTMETDELHLSPGRQLTFAATEDAVCAGSLVGACLSQPRTHRTRSPQEKQTLTRARSSATLYIMKTNGKRTALVLFNQTMKIQQTENRLVICYLGEKAENSILPAPKRTENTFQCDIWNVNAPNIAQNCLLPSHSQKFVQRAEQGSPVGDLYIYDW